MQNRIIGMHPARPIQLSSRTLLWLLWVFKGIVAFRFISRCHHAVEEESQNEQIRKYHSLLTNCFALAT